MLVLSRKLDQEIVIGDQIRITVLRVKGDRVKLGIQAGDHVKILRGELLEPGAPAAPHLELERGHAIVDPTAGLCED
ncbi:MAG: carbon storage regulator [Thermoguttaceae bacterium]